MKNRAYLMLAVLFLLAFVTTFNYGGCGGGGSSGSSNSPWPEGLIAEWRVAEGTGTLAPWGIAIDSESNIYVSELFGDRIEKFTVTGTYITRWGSSGNGNSQFMWPKFIDVDGSNNVYVADNMNHRVQKFTSDGTYITQWGVGGSGNSQFNGPTGIAVDITGTAVYVLDSNNHRIQKFDLSGGYIMQWGSSGTGNGQFNFLGGGPEGDVAVDSTGAVYVVDNGNWRIQKFTSDGTYITQWGANGSGPGQFLYPVGIAVDSMGTVYVTDNAEAVGRTSRVEKFNSSGTFISQWDLIRPDGSPTSALGIVTDSSGAVYIIQGESIAKWVR